MTKIKKIDWRVYAGAVIGLLLITTVIVNAQGVSLLDRIADKAGEILGMSLSDKIDLGEVSEDLGHAVQPTKWVKQGNRVTYIEGGVFNDASTTLVSFHNPFGSATTTGNIQTAGSSATSTAVSVNLDITGLATSSMTITCGASADAFTEPTYSLLYLALPTSTVTVVSNELATTTGGFQAIGGGGAAKVLLTHEYSYFVCSATGTPAGGQSWSVSGDAGTVGTGSKNGLIGGNNTFDGTWSVEIRKNLRN